VRVRYALAFVLVNLCAIPLTLIFFLDDVLDDLLGISRMTRALQHSSLRYQLKDFLRERLDLTYGESLDVMKFVESIDIYYAVRRVGHILSWVPFLLEDHDWDFAYILRVLEYKIARTRKCITKNNHISTKDIELICKRTRTCELLLRRLRDDDYIDLSSVFDENYDIGKTLSPEKSELLKKLNAHEVYLRNQDMDMLFKYLKKYGRSWWD
jgi:hypothetical protein